MENKIDSSSHPNLVIVGAPKCVTTALFTYLKQHPDIFMTDVKETNFFATDLFDLLKESGFTQQEYLDLFTNSNSAGVQHLSALLNRDLKY